MGNFGYSGSKIANSAIKLRKSEARRAIGVKKYSQVHCRAVLYSVNSSLD